MSNATPNPRQKADVVSLLDDHLSAGVFRDKINRALSECALASTVTGKKAKIVITLEMNPIGEKGESHQVEMKHTLQFLRPTERGEQTGKDLTKTPLYVGYGGSLSLFPEKAEQTEMFRAAAGESSSSED